MATKTVEKELEEIQPVRQEVPSLDDIKPATADVLQQSKRRGRPPGSKNKTTTARAGANLETRIGALLVTFNIPLQLIPAVQKDALDPLEIRALAKAINDECQRNAKFRKYVEQALEVQGATSLVAVVGIIAARRVVRHNVFPIPEEMGGSEAVDAILGATLNIVSSGQPLNASPIYTPSTE